MASNTPTWDFRTTIKEEDYWPAKLKNSPPPCKKKQRMTISPEMWCTDCSIVLSLGKWITAISNNSLSFLGCFRIMMLMIMDSWVIWKWCRDREIRCKWFLWTGSSIETMKRLRTGWGDRKISTLIWNNSVPSLDTRLPSITWNPLVCQCMLFNGECIKGLKWLEFDWQNLLKIWIMMDMIIWSRKDNSNLNKCLNKLWKMKW